LFDLLQDLLFALERFPMMSQSRFAGSETSGNRSQFIHRPLPSFLSLGDIRNRFGILRRELPESFVVVLNPAVVPVNLAF
jgi:hypothetical protein